MRREDVEVKRDWNAMGLKATATHSFRVHSKFVEDKYCFRYNELHRPHPIFKVPFSIFADLTLWANYLGMAQHFLAEAQYLLGPHVALYRLLALLTTTEHSIMDHGLKIEGMITDGRPVPAIYGDEIHNE